ncbi:hypothetical protein, partial [Yersinia pestis]
PIIFIVPSLKHGVSGKNIVWFTVECFKPNDYPKFCQFGSGQFPAPYPTSNNMANKVINNKLLR